ncbi:nodulation protein NfeD [Melioribacteraceae bacterium 4301-Me]|uniref:NfeD family protein n=1 Tax=Pyranulibacter aquaticus TaxID=3163344 RepID=UPI003597D12B
MKALILMALLLNMPIQQDSPKIDVIKIDGAINPVIASFIHDTLEKAKQEKTECLLIQLNTPGGLLKSTRIIVSDFLTSNIPIVVYVYPSGSQAASAGTIITLAANIAVMAPGTNIGAVHPVVMSEGNEANKKDSTNIMMEKVTNDAAAFIRSIAEKRHRNVEWAEKSVRESLSLTETEALKEKVIDFIARDLNELIFKINGIEVETASGLKTIHSKNAKLNFIEMNAFQKFLDIISDPSIAYILMMLGVYGLIFELSNPGSILPGIVGVISLILAFYSLHTLPINYAGLALIIFGIILFIAEIKVVSHGLLAAGGIISFLIGSLMFINTDTSTEFLSISLTVIITITILTALFFVFAVGKGITAQRRKPTTGSEGMIGEKGVALTNFNSFSSGKVLVHGEIWDANSADSEIKEGDNIEVKAVKGLKLIIKKVD